MTDFYFYTETAFHHEGNLEYIKELITATKESGAKGIKFQVLTNSNDFVSEKHTAFNDLSSYCFSYQTWIEIFNFTKKMDLDIIMMPLNIEALDLLNSFEVKFLEIHSVSFNDFRLLEKIREKKTDLIIGVGGRTIEEINEMQNCFGDQLKVLMVGFQAFPSKLEDIKLGKIAYLKKHYPNLQIGYADHSSFENEFAVKANEYAFLLGATIFEKHITVNEGQERIDFSAAVSKEKIKESIMNLEFLQKYVSIPDNDFLTFNEPELKYRNRQLICVANRKMDEGDTIKLEDINLKLIDVLEPSFSKSNDLVGRKVTSKIEFDSPFLEKNIL